MKKIYPKPTPIFHITSQNNLVNILHQRALCSKKLIEKRKISYQNVANPDIQDKRSRRNPALFPRTILHDYVPFYFAPRSPMLFAIKERPDILQEDIIYLLSDVETIAAAAELIYYFTDAHPEAYPSPREFNSVADIEQLAWDILLEKPHIDGVYAKWWQDDPKNLKWIDRKRKRQAEFLILNQLPWQYITQIATMTKEKAQQIEIMCRQYSDKIIPIFDKREWYY